jgi:N-acetylneuraminic acid mutarotase
VYDPRTRSWANTGPLVFASALHAATLLPDGEVLIAGGYGAIAAPTANAELYDPASNTWKPTGSMHSARATDSATLLSDGRVLVSGGMTKCDLFAADQSACVLARTELYTPSTGRWTETAPMHSRRFAFTATLLHTGQVLVVGGYSLLGGKPLSSSELYSP